LPQAAALGRSDPRLVRQNSLASSVSKPKQVIRVASATRGIIAGGQLPGADVTKGLRPTPDPVRPRTLIRPFRARARETILEVHACNHFSDPDPAGGIAVSTWSTT
jgi:hypothetical protein